MAKSKSYMDRYYAMAMSTASMPSDDGLRLGRVEKVTWESLNKSEARQLEADYNWQYERGVFEDDEGGYLYQADYRYYIIPHGFDSFEVINRRRLR